MPRLPSLCQFLVEKSFSVVFFSRSYSFHFTLVCLTLGWPEGTGTYCEPVRRMDHRYTKRETANTRATRQLTSRRFWCRFLPQSPEKRARMMTHMIYQVRITVQGVLPQPVGQQVSSSNHCYSHGWELSPGNSSDRQPQKLQHIHSLPPQKPDERPHINEILVWGLKRTLVRVGDSREDCTISQFGKG